MNQKLPKEILGNDKIIGFVKDVRLRNFQHYPNNQQQTITELYETTFAELKHQRSCPDSEFNSALVRVCKKFRENAPEWWHKHHENYKLTHKGRLEFDIVKTDLRGAILDLGCGEGYFALQCVEMGYPVFMTDVRDCRIDIARSLTFRQMIDPTVIPYQRNVVHTACVFFVFHHINTENLTKVLAELKRVASRVIVMEDVYGVSWNEEFKTQIGSDDLLQEFIQFSLDDQSKVLIFMDLITNFFIHGSLEMNLPFNFKTINDWRSLFAEKGFLVRRTHLIGFKRETSGITGSCHALFVLDKA